MAALTYLANTDPADGSDTFYTLARQHFDAAGATIVDAPAAGQTIEGILADLATRDTLLDTINIVCRPTGVGALALPLTAAEQAAGATITTSDDVQKAIANKTLAAPAATVVADTTRVVLHGADIGRSTTFLMRLASLFGNPGELLAPRRLSVFTPDGSDALYRQAQTWTRVGVEPLIPDGADEPSGGWPAFRSQFVSDLALLFGPAAVLAEDGGDTTLTVALTAAAAAATRTIQPPGFFFESGFDILPSGALSAQQVAEDLQPIANGDPVTAVAASAAEVDDTTLVTTVTFADAFALDAALDRYAIRVVQLARLIDADVPIAEGPGYARVTSSAGLAPAAASGTDAGYLQPMIDALLAQVIPQDVIDAVLAGAPQGDATDGLDDADSPDAVPIESVPDYPWAPVDLA
jgi:hypothetical protein